MSGKTAEVVLYETMKQAKQQEKTLTSCSTNDYLGEERRSALSHQGRVSNIRKGGKGVMYFGRV